MSAGPRVSVLTPVYNGEWGWQIYTGPRYSLPCAIFPDRWVHVRLVARGRIHPTVSRSYPLEQTGQAAYEVHRNAHQGKVGVLCLAPEEGLGVRDQARRARHEDAINLFRGR